MLKQLKAEEQNNATGVKDGSNYERDPSLEYVQSQLISQKRDQLAALLVKQEKEEKRVKQSTVLGRLFGNALAEGDESRPTRDFQGKQPKRQQQQFHQQQLDLPTFDRSTSEGSLDDRLIVRMKSNDGVNSYLKLVDGGVEYSDVSSPETPQPIQGSAQDLTWDEMADCGGCDVNDDGAREVNGVELNEDGGLVAGEVVGVINSSSTLSHVDARQQSDSRLLALIKGKGVVIYLLIASSGDHEMTSSY